MSAYVHGTICMYVSMYIRTECSLSGARITEHATIFRLAFSRRAHRDGAVVARLVEVRVVVVARVVAAAEAAARAAVAHSQHSRCPMRTRSAHCPARHPGSFHRK